MKTTRFFLIGAMAVLLSCFASCGKSGLSFGDAYFHPGYEITLNKEGTLVIEFSVIKTIIV